MNFYSVPAMSYQQQQKLKRKTKKSASRSSRKDSSSDNQDRSSLYSSIKSERSIPDDVNASDDKRLKHPSLSNKKTTGTSSTSLNSTTFTKPDGRKLSGDTLQGYSSKENDSESHRASQEDFRRSSISSSMASFVSGKFNRAAKSQLSQSSTPYEKSSHSFELDSRSEPISGHEEEQGTGPEPVPKFRPILDLSVLNDSESIKMEFINPESIRQRYQTFLRIISEHHINDPINFASVREQSMRSFARRLKQSHSHHIQGPSIIDKGDWNLDEDTLAYELLQMRLFLRKLIKDECIEQKKNPALSLVEEVLQSNHINYMRYLINLPGIPTDLSSNLNETDAQHYKFRNFLHEISSSLYAQKKEGFEDEISTLNSRVQLLVQAILKSSYEFILLEKYVIQILIKFHNDFLIESKITKSLFETYAFKMISGEKESVKCLVLNSFFSVNYSWYLAITIPFVRVLETCIFTDTARSTKKDHDEEFTANAEDFSSSDQTLFFDYFEKLKLKDFSSFVTMSRKKLVKLQEYHTLSEGTSGSHKRSSHPWRPPNFEFFSNSLSSIADNTFHVIHIRDFQIQFTSSNYRGVLVELARVLKPDGFLELPLMFSGGEVFSNTSDVFGDSYLNSCSATGENAQEAIPTTLRELFRELSLIFGKDSVSFATMILTENNEMNRLVLNKILFTGFEMRGNIEEFSDTLYGGKDSERGKSSYYVYIQVKNRS